MSSAFSWLPDKNVIVSLAAFLLNGIGVKSCKTGWRFE